MDLLFSRHGTRLVLTQIHVPRSTQEHEIGLDIFSDGLGRGGRPPHAPGPYADWHFPLCIQFELINIHHQFVCLNKPTAGHTTPWGTNSTRNERAVSIHKHLSAWPNQVRLLKDTGHLLDHRTRMSRSWLDSKSTEHWVGEGGSWTNQTGSELISFLWSSRAGSYVIELIWLVRRSDLFSLTAQMAAHGNCIPLWVGVHNCTGQITPTRTGTNGRLKSKFNLGNISIRL